MDFFNQIRAAIASPLAYVLVVGLLLALVMLVRSRLRKTKQQARHLPQMEPGHHPIAPATIPTIEEEGWLTRLRSGLSKTRESFNRSLAELITGKKHIDEGTLAHLYEVLYRSDVGPATADKLVKHVRESLKSGTEYSWEDIRGILAGKTREILAQEERAFKFPADGPLVVLIVGVNGVGKTTTIGKLAAQFLEMQKSVLLCAADTYRAAAIDQLKVWGERLTVPVIAQQEGADPAAVAYDGVKAAKARKVDVLLIDTAGRLHNKKHLMEELAKINRVIGKDLPEAPHETLLVLDATTGQNAFSQVEAFRDIVNVSGVMVTKLDGTAKGGVVIGISDKYRLPIRYIGVGEKVTDLKPFHAEDFVTSLMS